MFKKKVLFICVFLVLVTALIVYLNVSGFDKIKYSKAINLAEVGEYDKAISLMEELGETTYEETKELKYSYAIQCIEEKDVEKAQNLLNEIGKYKDSENLHLEIAYIEAGNTACNEGILSALPLYEKLPQDYKDVREIIEKINEWSVYNGTWSRYFDSINMKSVSEFTIYFDDDKIYCRADDWRTDLKRLEIVNREAKFSFQSMEFFVNGMIIHYDGKEYTKYVRGSNANSANTIKSLTSSAFGVDIKDTIVGTTNPDADDYYKNENAASILAEKEADYNKAVDEMRKINEPAIGMTASEVEKSTWGKPDKINKTTYAWGTREQWCYSNYRYIYFTDGKVSAISE